MKTTIRLFALSIIILLSSCQKDKGLMNNNGILKNLTGFDGCGWVIQINQNGTTKSLEPTNLGEFNVPLVDGKKVEFSYKKTESPSICMVGDVVKLTSLKDK